MKTVAWNLQMKNLLSTVPISALNRSRTILIAGTFLLFVTALPVLAEAGPDAEAINWLNLGMGLFGGLALFLFGMEQMSEGLKAAAGETLKDVLARLTKNRFAGALTGAFVTAVLNSSSVTTVLVVGFISAGFMTLSQSVGVIMGANIGSTFTAQIVAFNVTQYALIMVAGGFLMLFIGKAENTRHYGAMIMGLGLVFYGMGVMGDAMLPLRTYQPFLDLMVRMENPLLGILVGAVFTGLVQSSAATTGIAIVMASAGLISLPAGIALAFGANIGTCVTAILASLGKPVEAVRAAMVHITFNVAGVLLWVMFIPQLADFVAAISPSAPGLSGKSQMAAEVPRQIANAHTVFNVANTLFFIGFTSFFARLAEKLVPERITDASIIVKPEFLDEAALVAPSIALQQVRMELGRVGAIALGMLQDVVPAIRDRDMKRLEKIALRDDEIDILEVEILNYLAKLRRGSLTEQEGLEFQGLMIATDNLEGLADIIETDIVSLARKLTNIKSRSGDETRIMLQELYVSVTKSVELAVQAVRDNDQQAAASVLMMKDTLREQSEQLLERKAMRLVADDPDYLALVRLEMSFVDQMRRIYTLAKRIAKVTLPPVIAHRD
jgi:phosphate:Na+ symporter